MFPILWSGCWATAAITGLLAVRNRRESVVPPNHLLLIGLLVAFEATVGLLVLSGGRRTQVGYVCTIGFHLALWLFGWFETVYCLVMLPALVLLLRAEQRATAAATAPAGRTQVAAWH
jgi:hypothetical protein